jgi:hypothetical protein
MVTRRRVAWKADQSSTVLLQELYASVEGDRRAQADRSTLYALALCNFCVHLCMQMLLYDNHCSSTLTGMPVIFAESACELHIITALFSMPHPCVAATVS